MFNFTLISASSVALALTAATGASALSIGADFVADYSATSLGSVPGLPTSYGGLNILAGTTDTLLIGGAANGSSGRLYTIGVTRDADTQSITGFTGTARRYGQVGEYNDGGVAYGPDGVLFTARWNINHLGQTKPGSLDEDRVDALGPFGVGGSSISALNFVPTGFDNAGQGKIVSWSSGNWYDLELSPDGNGTFDIDTITQIDLDPDEAGIQGLPGGPEGFVYIKAGNKGFAADSLLVSDYTADRVSAYEIDAAANPILSTRRDFITGLDGAEGALIDPVTGDFLFSTFGGGNQVVRVDGFGIPVDPTPTVPVPASALLLLSGLAAAAGLGRRKA